MRTWAELLNDKYSFLGFFFSMIICLLGMMLVAVVSSFIKNKIEARVEQRKGNKAGVLNGLLLFLLDSLKLVFKKNECKINNKAITKKISSILILFSTTMLILVIPFGYELILVSFDSSLLILLISVLIAALGFLLLSISASNYAVFIGGNRSILNQLGFLFPIIISLATIILKTGTLSIASVALSQGGLPNKWLMFKDPFVFVSSCVFFVSLIFKYEKGSFSLAGEKYTLAGGVDSYYSDIDHLWRYLQQNLDLLLWSFIFVTLFLGSWHLPFGFTFKSTLAQHMFEWLNVVLKSLFVYSLIIWIGSSLPKIKNDKILFFSTNVLSFISFICLMGVSMWMVLFK